MTTESGRLDGIAFREIIRELLVRIWSDWYERWGMRRLPRLVDGQCIVCGWEGRGPAVHDSTYPGGGYCAECGHDILRDYWGTPPPMKVEWWAR